MNKSAFFTRREVVQRFAVSMQDVSDSVHVRCHPPEYPFALLSIIEILGFFYLRLFLSYITWCFYIYIYIYVCVCMSIEMYVLFLLYW